MLEDQSQPTIEPPKPPSSRVEQAQQTIDSFESTQDLAAASEVLTNASLNDPELRDQVSGLISQRKEELAHAEAQEISRLASELREKISKLSLQQLEASSSDLGDLALSIQMGRDVAVGKIVYGPEGFSDKLKNATFDQLTTDFAPENLKQHFIELGMSPEEAVKNVDYLDFERKHAVDNYLLAIFDQIDGATVDQLHGELDTEALQQKFAQLNMSQEKMQKEMDRLSGYRQRRLSELGIQ